MALATRGPATDRPTSPDRTNSPPLKLDANEGPRSPLADPRIDLTRYPSTAPLERRIAEQLGVSPEQVAVTAGADEAIDRVLRGLVGIDGSIALPVPTFEMIERYAALSRVSIESVTWERGAFPREAFVSTAEVADVDALFVVSPNNPTGLSLDANTLERLRESCPGRPLIVDAAYADFARDDLTPTALTLEDTVVLRSFSKGPGLAALRVGYAVGCPKLIDRVRAAGLPFPVAAESVALAMRWLDLDEEEKREGVERVRAERDRLREVLTRRGRAARFEAQVEDSDANFVLVRSVAADWIENALRTQGIAVRRWPGRSLLEDALRMTLPGNETEYRRLERALDAALAPEGFLFDLDGVLAEVSGSYDVAVRRAASSFGLAVSTSEIARVRCGAGVNDDVDVLRALLNENGLRVTPGEVARRFQDVYDREQLANFERLTVDPDALASLSDRYPIAIVTGRPRTEALDFLERFEIRDRFDAVIAREDAPLKPDPAPVRLALERLGISRAWMFGDTPDDMRAAAGAGVIPVGIALSPSLPFPLRAERRAALETAGAARVLPDAEAVLQWLR
ncbi:MAG: aminotransferase class I/II-fold pyridoxal phosphate-dependent enzyme [Planctomycetota bacterium]